MSRIGWAAVGAVLAHMGLAHAVEGQTALVEPRVFAVSPSVQEWTFSDPVRTDSLAVTSAGQVSVPLSLSFTPARNWRVDLSGAYTVGRITLADGASGTELTVPLRGPTDAKIRAVGRMLGDRLWLTLGVNLPTGRTGLTDDETVAIRALGAPALRMTTPVLGSGTGFIVGPVVTGRFAGWSVGLGASFELRGSYSPLDAGLAGGAGAELDPAEALHLSFALERLVGQGKMSFLLAADRYGTDQVTLTSEGGPAVNTEYRLGPTFEGRWIYRIVPRAVREIRFEARAQRRSEFSDGAGARVVGSAGTYLDGGVTVTFGRAGSLGVVVQVQGSHDSGLDVDDTLATASMSGGTVRLGLDVPMGRHRIQPFVRGGVNSLDTGGGAVAGRLLSAGLSIRTRW